MRPRLSAVQTLTLGYALLALVGALLLMLPAASEDGSSQPFIDALFTASSAVTTTGLAVVDTGGHYSLLGEAVILVLIQIGGLGYMIVFGTLLYAFHRRPSLGGRLAFQESLAGITLVNAPRFIRAVVLVTAGVELTGAAVLAFLWRDAFPPAQVLWLALFHSVSAFCAAGFSLFADSLSAWRDDVAVNAVVLAIAVTGASGFLVLFDVARRARGVTRRLSLHSRISLAVSIALAAAGTAVLLLAERPAHILPCLFQVISASTGTGYNTVEIGTMAPASLFFIVLLMFIGAAPGGTGGGIKTTTFGVIAAKAWTTARGGGDVNVGGRRIPPETVGRALSIVFLSMAIVAVDVLVLCATVEAPFLALLFECVSAFGTVGLSMGVTPALGVAGKAALSVTMLVGRIGPLAIGLSLAGRPPNRGYRYPVAEVFIG